MISLGAAVAGAGLALAHETVAGDLLARNLLVRPFEHAVPMLEAYYLVKPAQHAKTDASRAFTAWLLEEIGNGVGG